MKRLLIAGFSLVIVAAVAVSFFCLSAEPDRFRPQVQRYLSEILQQEVEMGPISLEWRGLRPVFFVRSVTVKNAASGQTLLQAGKVWASVRLLPLLERQLIADHFVLEEAHFSIVRDEKGHWNCLPGKNADASAVESGGKGPDAWKFHMNSFEARGASVYYVDRSALPFFHRQWKELDITLARPSGAAFSLTVVPRGNRFLKKLFMDQPTHQAMYVSLDFGSWGAADIEITNPFQEARFDAVLGLKQVDLKAFPIGEGPLSLIGGEGLLSAKGEASWEGFHPGGWGRTLILKGVLQITDGCWKGRTVVSELLNSLAPLPGFSNLTRKPFTDDFYDFSNSPDSVFEVLSGSFLASEGKIFVEGLTVAHPFFRIETDGQLDLSLQRAALQGTFFFLDPFARELILRARDLDVLMNREGELAVPFSVEGRFKEARLSADLFYIANRMIQIRGQELASRGIQKLNEFLEAYQQ